MNDRHSSQRRRRCRLAVGSRCARAGRRGRGGPPHARATPRGGCPARSTSSWSRRSLSAATARSWSSTWSNRWAAPIGWPTWRRVLARGPRPALHRHARGRLAPDEQQAAGQGALREAGLPTADWAVAEGATRPASSRRTSSRPSGSTPRWASTITPSSRPATARLVREQIASRIAAARPTVLCRAVHRRPRVQPVADRRRERPARPAARGDRFLEVPRGQAEDRWLRGQVGRSSV